MDLFTFIIVYLPIILLILFFIWNRLIKPNLILFKIKDLLQKNHYFYYSGCGVTWGKDISDLDRFKYAQMILDSFAHELKTNKELPSLLKIIKDLENKLSRGAESYSNLSDEIRRSDNRYNLLLQNSTQTEKRFEQEVIHLKELVQEKNMVIDKLLTEKNKCSINE